MERTERSGVQRGSRPLSGGFHPLQTRPAELHFRGKCGGRASRRIMRSLIHRNGTRSAGDSGLLKRINRCEKPAVSLAAYELAPSVRARIARVCARLINSKRDIPRWLIGISTGIGSP